MADKSIDYKKDTESVLNPKILVQLMNRKKSTQIVQTEQSNKKKPEEAKFLSNKNNSFARQTKNKNLGKFAAASKGLKTANERKKTQITKSKINKKLKNIKFSDLAIKSSDKLFVKKNRKVAKANSQRKGLKNGKAKGQGLGKSNDFLEDIPLGDFTQLNTQEYEFYGFYHRIREKLEQFWGNNLQTEADKIFKQGRSIASDNNLITGLTIKINSRGEIVDIVLNSTSGLKELDDAAVKSFNQAGPFPNPPKGMIKADGKAVIEWGFVVNT
jgi:protein TonB